jgi:hypothetical protein
VVRLTQRSTRDNTYRALPLKFRLPAIVFVVVGAETEILDGWIWLRQIARRSKRTVGLELPIEVGIGCSYLQLLDVIDERCCGRKRRLALYGL